MLCASLGLTTALAWWVGHVRAAAQMVVLGQPQTFANDVLPIEVCLPPLTNWALEETNGNGFSVLDISEETSRYGTHRSIQLWLVRADVTGEPPLTLRQFADQQARGRSAIGVSQLDFLDTSGIVVEYPVEYRGKSAGRFQASPAMLVACAMVQKPIPTIVCLQMDSLTEFTPTDHELIQLLAKSLSLVNPAHAAPTIPKAEIKRAPPGTISTDPGGASDNDDGN